MKRNTFMDSEPMVFVLFFIVFEVVSSVLYVQLFVLSFVPAISVSLISLLSLSKLFVTTITHDDPRIESNI